MARPQSNEDATCDTGATEIRCPRCGFVSEGIRCERCDALKITQCSGSCTMCGLAKCVAPKVREQSGL